MPSEHARQRPLPEEVWLLQYDLMLAPAIPDAAPQDVREGMARRRLLLLNGSCVCGARVIPPNRAQRRAGGGAIVTLLCVHEPDCPASNENLRDALDAWSAQ